MRKNQREGVEKSSQKNKMKYTRAQVVALKNAGRSQREAAGVIGKPLSCVER